MTQAPDSFLANHDGAWIMPDATDLETVCAIVRQCPSGALTYDRLDGKAEQAPPVRWIAVACS
ncbi:hypothetical protein SKP52_13125 [Sphingopyxis fribergensis]|uniref:Divergent 4Fe-4S mono-cluster domain-containing protein n=1 Tax=Sphingopyxis fribergensis TaxID=1515612 RepID=A0A0A7PJU1_9SPHN|nr:(4Fe-4S)-binding protein [Sphingopyxis fribergensis]AJA09513.1 hypothetical protein SKP52_13125 [Sphingopyxis fribergensis]